MSEAKPIEPGLCQCGCGGRTYVYPSRCAKMGIEKKGEFGRFIRGHSGRLIKRNRPPKPEKRVFVGIEIAPGDRERFEEFLYPDPNSGCYLFVGATAQKGHGQFTIGRDVDWSRRIVSAHRFAWVLSGQELPPAGMVLRHKCHTPCCCNPDHLAIGTYRDNNHDMARAGRGSRAQKSGLPYGVQTSGKRFAVRLGPTGARETIGSFDTIEEAAIAAIEARKRIYGG